MKNISSSPLIALVMAISITTLSGCGDDSGSSAPSPKEVQFLSHIDQAKFYQNQGQLKASISESRSAIQLYPNRLKPYIVIFETLLLAGNPGEVELRINELLTKEDINLQGSEQKLHYLLAKSLYIQQKLDLAQTELDFISSNFKTLSEEEKLLQGDIYLAKGETDKAKELFTTISAADNTNVDALLGLSKVALLEEKPELAREIVTKVTNSDNSTTEAWLWKARLAHIEQNYDEAEESYVRALEDLSQVDTMTPQKYSTISSLIFVLRQQSKIAEASRYQDILDQSIPGEIKLRFETALEYFKKSNYDAAETELNAILEISSAHNPSGILLGIVKNYQGDIVEAERILSLYVNDNTKPEIIKLLASLQLKLDKASSAVETLQLGLTKNDTDASLISLLGISQIASGLNEEGIKNIEEAMLASPSDIELKIKYAQALSRTGKKQEALEFIANSFNEKPDSGRLLIAYGYYLSDTNQTDKAIKISKDWIKRNSKVADGYLVLGSLYLSSGQFSPAIEQFSKAKSIETKNPLIQLNLGKSYAGNKQPEEAKNAFFQAVNLAPDSPDVNRTLYNYLSATQTMDEVITSYEKLVDKLPNATLPHIALAELYLKQNSFEKSLAIVNAPRFSNNIVAQNLLKAAAQAKAKQLVSEGKTKEAKNFIDGLIANQKSGDIGLSLLLANIYYISKEEASGLGIINDLKKSHPESPLPYEFLANRYFQKQEYESAINEYSQAWEIKPSELLAIKMSQTLKRLESNEALNPLIDWLAIEKDSPRVMTMLAMSYQETGEEEKAIATYEELLAVHTNNAVAMNNLAWLYHEQKNPKAEELAKKASEIAAGNPAILDTYGWILFENGRAKEASAVLENAYRLDQTSTEIKEHLLAAYKAIGKTFNDSEFK